MVKGPEAFRNPCVWRRLHGPRNCLVAPSTGTNLVVRNENAQTLLNIFLAQPELFGDLGNSCPIEQMQKKAMYLPVSILEGFGMMVHECSRW
jgi:hypothetical protein